MKLKLALAIVKHTDSDDNIRYPIQEGLRIITTCNRAEDVCAEHDQIWAGLDGEDCLEGMSAGKVELLAQMGWFIDTEINRWSHFV